MKMDIDVQQVIYQIKKRFDADVPPIVFDFRYDSEADVLDIRFREYSDSISDAIDDEGMVISIHDPKTDEIVGLEIMCFKEIKREWENNPVE